MSDDLDKKIQQIAQMLGQDEVPDNVKELVAMLANSLGKKEEGNSHPIQADASSKDERPDEGKLAADTPAANPETLNSAKNVLERFSGSNDPRINLLLAIKPFMNNRRQRKIGSCIQLLQIAGLGKIVNEHEK